VLSANTWQGDLILEAADILSEDPVEHCLIPFERVHLPLRPVLSASAPSIVPTISHDLVSSEAIHRHS